MSVTDPMRPDPDQLLQRVAAQDRRAARGRLRIYFGASAGVGKTWSMLAAARALAADGQDVLVGVAETHGRADTIAQLEGLPVLPLAMRDYDGNALAEFDLDAALARRPACLLIDELAHANAPGSRHPKRWQDVDELLDAGINVFSTLNVQHLESLNDVVGGITGIRVNETLPDTVFDHADEVVLVDVPADELLARLRVGKIYQQAQAERAARNFFRKGNLIALRELALRRMAERLETDVQAYRVEQSIGHVWKTGNALLACVGPGAAGEHVVRATARLAAQINADWQAIYVETPRLQRLSASRREQILNTLKLAQSLGATTAILSGSDAGQVIVEHARGHNISRIVLGRSTPSHWWRSGVRARIAAAAPDVDLLETGRADIAPRKEEPAGAVALQPLRIGRYVIAAAASLLTAVVALPLLPWLHPTNIAMLQLLTVVLVAMQAGRRASVVATVVGVAAFDFFFVEPRFSFAVGDLQYLVAFCVMLAVGLLIGHLTSGLRYQARVASHREARSRALYEFARDLSSALQTEQVSEIGRDAIARTFRARATLLVPDADGRLQAPPARSGDAALGVLDVGIAQWAFDHGSAAGIGTDTLPGSSFFYLPLRAPMRVRGVLAILPHSRRWILIPEQRQQLDIFAALAAIALERVHYVEVAQQALLQMESERLRNSLLAALSHDLRTPLTALVGLSESLVRANPALAATQQETAEALHEEALRMSRLVANLLDMARFQSGQVQLNLQWQTVEEAVGSALRLSRQQLAGHQVQTRLPNALPLVRFDALLIERVLCNLLENASRYTPPGSTIAIGAREQGAFLELTVSDNGPGLPAGKEEAIFDKFTRGQNESATPGVGLGLAICRAIVQAHGGSIVARAAPGGGAVFAILLPLGAPPALPNNEEDTMTEANPT